MTSHKPDLERIVSSSNLNDLFSAMGSLKYYIYVEIIKMYFLVARHENYNILGSPKIVHGEGFESYATKSVPHEVSDGSQVF